MNKKSYKSSTLVYKETRRNLNGLDFSIAQVYFQIDSTITNMEKQLLSIEKNDKPNSTNLEYEESTSNDFVAQMPMFITKLESNILLLLFSVFDTSYKIFVLMEDQLTPMSM